MCEKIFKKLDRSIISDSWQQLDMNQKGFIEAERLMQLFYEYQQSTRVKSIESLINQVAHSQNFENLCSKYSDSDNRVNQNNMKMVLEQIGYKAQFQDISQLFSLVSQREGETSVDYNRVKQFCEKNSSYRKSEKQSLQQFCEVLKRGVDYDSQVMSMKLRSLDE